MEEMEEMDIHLEDTAAVAITLRTVIGSVTTGTGRDTVITDTGCTITESVIGLVITGPGDGSVATGTGVAASTIKI